jgi:hypothetical protein
MAILDAGSGEELVTGTLGRRGARNQFTPTAIEVMAGFRPRWPIFSPALLKSAVVS